MATSHRFSKLRTEYHVGEITLKFWKQARNTRLWLNFFKCRQDRQAIIDNEAELPLLSEQEADSYSAKKAGANIELELLPSRTDPIN